MSKIKVNSIEAATGTTITIPSGQTLDISSTTLTLPSTVVTTTGTQTLTNKTIGVSQLTGTLPVTNGGTGLTTLGSASQVLRVNSGATALEFGTVSAGFTSGTAVNGSGSVIDFTSIPATAKYIIIGIKEVVTSDNGKFGIQLGTSSGITTSGYKGGGAYIYPTNSGNAENHTNGFFVYSGSSSHIYNGIIQISNLNANVWVSTSGIYLSDTQRWDSAGGSISLASTLDRVRITTSTGGSISSGTINIQYI
jgi:hypothetical protein